MDKLSSIKVFLQVARLGSFSAAASHLNMSKAMTSKHVSYLENELDVRLLNRTTRHINLTESGTAYRDRVQGVMDELEETELSVRKLSSEPSGLLRVMAPTSFGSFHLTRAIAEYRELYPKVSVDMMFTSRTPDFIGDGLDLAIRVGELKDSNQVARKLAHSRLVVCAAPEYLEKYETPKVPSDLTHHNCLLYSPRLPLGTWPFRGKDGAYTVRVNGNVKANMGDALRIAAINGCGIIQSPTYVVGLDIKAGRLKVILEEHEAIARPIYAVYLHRLHLSAKVKVFVDFLYKLYQPLPYWEHWADEDNS